MNRRGFLTRAGIGAVVAGAAGWLCEASAHEGPGDGPSPHMLFFEVQAAYERAQRTGRPFLVFVIPSSDDERWDRGSAFGAYLNHGRPEQLAPLALCEVATATMEQLRHVEPAVGRGEPLMLVLEGDGAGPRVAAVRARLPRQGYFPDAEEEDGRIDRVAKAATRLIAADDELLWRRVSAARAFDPEGAASLDDALSAGEVPTLEMCARAGAIALQAAAWGHRRRPEILAALAESVNVRFVGQPLAGSYWAQASGCGDDVVEDVVDGDTRLAVCGMGFVPEKSRRFLRFLASDEAPLCRSRDSRVPGSGYCIR